MRNKRKKMFLLIGIGSTVLLLSLLVVRITNYPILSKYFGVSLVSEYNTLSELEKDSSVIVDATVIESEYFSYDDIPFTLNKMTINKVYKGEFKKGDSINVLETGGVINNIDYAPEDDKVMKKKDKVILYLYKYEGPIKEEVEKYVISGLYQGKFKYDKDINHITPSEKNKGELAIVDSIEDLNLSDKED